MDVSENSGTPKSSILIGLSIINHPFWDTTIFGNTHVDEWKLLLILPALDLHVHLRFPARSVSVCHLSRLRAFENLHTMLYSYRFYHSVIQECNQSINLSLNSCINLSINLSIHLSIYLSAINSLPQFGSERIARSFKKQSCGSSKCGGLR